MHVVEQLAVLVRQQVLLPGRPDRTVRQLAALARWGFGLGGEIRQAAYRSPDVVAVIDEDRGEVTYGEWLTRTRKVTTALRDLGLTPGDLVGILGRNHMGVLELLTGASSAGIDTVLLNTGLSRSQTAAVAETQGLAVLIHDDEFTPVVADCTTRVISETEFLGLVEAADEAPEVPVERPGRSIILTSGTTGLPKGAKRGVPKGFNALASILSRIPLHPRERVLLSAPAFHTWGYAALQLCIGLRATLVLQRRFDPLAAREALNRHECTVMFAVPIMLQRMLEAASDAAASDAETGDAATGDAATGAAANGDAVAQSGSQALAGEPGRAGGRRLRIVATSGSAYPGGMATRFMAEYGPVLYNLYGSTEASWVSIANPHDLAEHPHTAGRPPRGTTVHIVDGEGARLPAGEVGRIFVGNDLIFEGYTSGATKEFLGDLVSTGDLGVIRDGLLFVEGREDDMIVSGGENVYPTEVEDLIADIDGVREVSVFGVPDEQFGQRLAAYVVLAPGATLDGDAIRAEVKTHASRHAVPREVLIADELPRNATGKVLVRELRERYAARG